MSVPAKRLPLSLEGKQRARELTKEFADDLTFDAGRTAKKYGAEQASASHVEEAAGHLYRRTQSRRSDIAIALGGFGGGVTGGAFVSFAAAGTSAGSTITSALLSAAFLVLLMWGLFSR